MKRTLSLFKTLPPPQDWLADVKPVNLNEQLPDTIKVELIENSPKLYEVTGSKIEKVVG
jgi:hypothetical protein